MKVHLKKLRDQVMVITGASSGIGHTTARMAAERGARLVLAARNEDALRQLCDEIHNRGGQAVYVVTDVSSEQEMRRVAYEAQGRFGGFDTWVNNAGTSIYGPAMEVTMDDAHRLFEINFWGTVYGSRIAVEHLRSRGGALINIGSEVSDTAVPMQAFYSATKHAVKGFTDALRNELEQEGASISFTLIKPGPIDTPFTQNAKNLMEDAPTHVPPVYAPDIVAEAILYAAENPIRDLMIGGGAKLMSELGKNVPALADIIGKKMMISGTHSGRPVQRDPAGALYKPQIGGEERGDYQGHVMERSYYTSAAMHPMLAGMLGIGASVAIAALVRKVKQ